VPSFSVRITDLTVSYNRVPAVHHLTAELASGRSVGLVGPNGAGKTTLLKSLAGLLRPETGSISFSDGRKTNSRVAYLPQRGSVDWDFPITVRGVVEMGRYVALGPLRPFRSNDDEVVHDALRIADLLELENRQIRMLSGGQQQRVFLARAWAQNADLYLLDEPLSGLDRDASARFLECLRWLRDAGKSLLCSHHDLTSVPQIFDDVLLINGELVAFGPVETTFTPEAIERTYSTHIFAGETR